MELPNNWRYWVGTVLLAAAGLVILAGVGILLAADRNGEPQETVILVLAGVPEILCLLAAAILGKDNYRVLARKARRALRRPDPNIEASRLRYYAGLAGCLFNGVPLALYTYIPEGLPGGTAKMGILVVSDLIFFGSLFLAGGEFWEKFRRLFVWEGDRPPT